ncbi:Tfp pilus assembly protein FimT/FimU [Patescibacteria group bacterium]
MTKRGFTLLELMIVISIIIVVGAFTIPVGIKFFQSQALEDTTDSIVETLRRARNQAVFQKNDSSFGVKFASTSFTLFQGDTYTSRDTQEDEVFDLVSGVNTNGIDEIVFSRIFGTTTADTLDITLDDNSRSIDINIQGKVEK